MAAAVQPVFGETGAFLRAFQPSDGGPIMRLLAQGRPEAFLSHKQRVFDWQFLANPARAARAPFVVAEDRGHVVGAVGLMPVRARIGGRSQTVSWALDVVVAESHRGQGLGKKLIQQAASGGQCALVFGISDMSDPIFAQQGWRLDTSVQTMFMHLAEPGLRGMLKNLASRAQVAMGALRPQACMKLRVERAIQPPAAAELDALWLRVGHQYPNAVVRDAAYLHWRYRDAPVLPYRWLQTKQGDAQLDAVLITRHSPDESVLVDYLGPLDRPGLLRNLLQGAVRDLAAQGTRRIRCECNHPQLQQALASLGFRNYHRPSRFRIKAGRSNDAAPSGPWFLMTGDSDNDLMDLRQTLG
jgi:GNAT superfamily N-acetyltransferase